MAARDPWDMSIGLGQDGVLDASTPCFDVVGHYTTPGEGIEIEADKIEAAKIEAAKIEDSGSEDAACDIVQEAGGDLLLKAFADAQRWAIDAAGVLTVFPESGVADCELTLEPMVEPGPMNAPVSSAAFHQATRGAG